MNKKTLNKRTVLFCILLGIIAGTITAFVHIFLHLDKPWIDVMIFTLIMVIGDECFEEKFVNRKRKVKK